MLGEELLFPARHGAKGQRQQIEHSFETILTLAAIEEFRFHDHAPSWPETALNPIKQVACLQFSPEVSDLKGLGRRGPQAAPRKELLRTATEIYSWFLKFNRRRQRRFDRDLQGSKRPREHVPIPSSIRSNKGISMRRSKISKTLVCRSRKKAKGSKGG